MKISVSLPWRECYRKSSFRNNIKCDVNENFVRSVCSATQCSYDIPLTCENMCSEVIFLDLHCRCRAIITYFPAPLYFLSEANAHGAIKNENPTCFKMIYGEWLIVEILYRRKLRKSVVRASAMNTTFLQSIFSLFGKWVQSGRIFVFVGKMKRDNNRYKRQKIAKRSKKKNSARECIWVRASRNKLWRIITIVLLFTVNMDIFWLF